MRRVLKKRGLFLLLALAVVFSHCARITSPVGGPKDITPPKVLECSPANHSAHFKGNKFSITFDEYVKVDKISQQLLVSPPMKELPDYKLRKKTLTLSFKDTLKPNTTYTVFFGDAIADLNEGNILKNFSYVFSTGNYVDSLSMRGVVMDALSHKPADNVTVMLYKNNIDTIPLFERPLYQKPYYVSKTDKKGRFYFSGLADATYLLFALQDQNYSLTFDQPNEKIAFIDSLVVPKFRPAPVIDSAILDTIRLYTPKDSVQYKIDSVIQRADSIANLKLTDYKMYLFSQPDSVQKLLRSGLVKKNTIKFIFALPSDSLKIKCLNFNPDTIWYLPEWNSAKDSLVWYLHEPHPDTLDLVVFDGHKVLDSLEDMRVIPKENKLKRRRKKKKELKKEFLEWQSNIKNTIKPGDTLKITFGQPVASIHLDSALLVQKKDSTYHPKALFLDSIHRVLAFPFPVKENEQFSLTIPDSTITDWNGVKNDNIRLSFKSKKSAEYGILTFDMKPLHERHYLIQMLDNKGKVLSTRKFIKNQEIRFVNLQPETYQFRVIFDDNGNGHWDPGNYFLHLEPERVIYFPVGVKVRANWEIKEDWTIK